MADQNDERKLDELLDSALSEYSAVEPRLGLEGRILARIQNTAEQPQARWWSTGWLVAAIGAAIAVIMLGVLFLRPVHKPQQVQVRKEPAFNQTQPDNNRMAQKLRTVHEGNHPHRVSVRPELARSDRPSVFPTPTGLSEQERLMLAYLAQTPKEEFIAQLQRPQPEEEEFWKDQQPAATRSQR